ncbi:MAG: AAA family ATPase [Muribaculum sp.]|nr:AAA family ATPase [Muribaculum sp.]
MKYINLTSLVAAYQRNAKTTSNKFWGVLGILYAIRENILPGKSYSFNPDLTAQFLENLFNLGEKKEYSGSRSKYYAMFSKVWFERLGSLMCSEQPNFFDVAAWFFRREEFSSNPSQSDLMNLFSQYTGFSTHQMKTLFSFEPREIQYNDVLYKDSQLLSELSKLNSNPNNYTSVTAEGKFIKSSPGAFGSAPFIQTLYSAQQSTECLFLTQFPIFDYYFTENSSEEIVRQKPISETETVVEDSTLKQFAYKFFKYLYDLDRFSAFWNSAFNGTGWNDATFRTIKDSEKGIYLTGFLRADKNDDGQYFPNGFELDGHTWFLSTNWCKQEFVPDTNSRHGLSAIGMQRLIEYFYPSHSMEISESGYRLIRNIPPTKSYQSKILPEFWNHVGQATLEVDANFSKLPLYYHKGHIRVRTNYGGACNFSVGFYDDKSNRVNKDVSFIYDGVTGSDNEHLFFLDTDIRDTTAFIRFIPVFNEAYQGLFQISIEGETYSFLDLREKPTEPYRSKKRRQVIYFGAPGTGKSYAVNSIVKAEAPNRNVRTTFHPDTDYSSFVGCFKPTMRDGNIEYSFTPQAFVNAYIGAWSDLSKPFYLVIEEINRGNCAQIFGDIFQLLDRNSFGESNYGIKPDTDLQSYIFSKLGLLSNLPEEIRCGSEMRLPANLFIYATMNTSDQSLFPIDSAFKRRWDMRYTAIKPGKKDHTLIVGGHRYNWTSFIRKVNERIYNLTKSEDKQLGYWFIQPDDDGNIDWELFVSKAIFYIWNDVVKDYASMEKEDSPFGKKFSFSTFFDEDGNPIIDQTVAFLDALGVEKVLANPQSSNIQDNLDDDMEGDEVDDLNETSSQGKSTGSKFSYVLDGENFSGIGKAIIAIVNKLGENFTFDEIADSFNRIVKKTHKNGPAIMAQHPSGLNPDENGRNRWYVNPFKDKNGKEFSLISLWPDSYFDRIKDWVESYPDLFPQGFKQVQNKIPSDE